MGFPGFLWRVGSIGFRVWGLGCFMVLTDPIITALVTQTIPILGHLKAEKWLIRTVKGLLWRNKIFVPSASAVDATSCACLLRFNIAQAPSGHFPQNRGTPNVPPRTRILLIMIIRTPKYYSPSYRNPPKGYPPPPPPPPPIFGNPQVSQASSPRQHCQPPTSQRSFEDSCQRLGFRV